MTPFSTILLQFRSPKGVPYDSTQGVPDYVFIIFWIILIAFGVRIAWEFRDKIFPKKQEVQKTGKVKPPSNNERR
jgi:hypothetical protein